MIHGFPIVRWGDQLVTFRPVHDDCAPQCAPGAALVFAFDGPHIVLVDIRNRGWCIPGGRVEPGELAAGAARREAWEEAGLTLGSVKALGETVALASENPEQVLSLAFVADVERIDNVPEGSESLAARLALREELDGCYYHWDLLMAAMFDFAWEHRPLRNPC